MFIAILADEEFASYDLGSLRTGIMAGASCPVEVMKRVMSEMQMREVTICYGMTETSPVSTQTGANDSVEQRVSTVGQVHPHVEIKIVDPESGQPVERGQSGELLTRGYSVMVGYWNDPEKTAESIDSQRWMHTGDLAVMDEDGYLNIVGRIKDMIIRGGENIYPREIEEFFFTHPEVEDVQVIGVPDERFGEEIMAWVKLQEGSTLTDEELRDFCKGKIAHYKVPRYVKIVEEFPMTVTGKVQKFKMQETAIEELGLEGAAGIEDRLNRAIAAAGLSTLRDYSALGSNSSTAASAMAVSAWSHRDLAVEVARPLGTDDLRDRSLPLVERARCRLAACRRRPRGSDRNRRRIVSSDCTNMIRCGTSWYARSRRSKPRSSSRERSLLKASWSPSEARSRAWLVSCSNVSSKSEKRPSPSRSSVERIRTGPSFERYVLAPGAWISSAR